MTKYVVTGAGGSIGSALCERLIEMGAERLVLLSLTEGGLYNIERKLRALNTDAEIVGVLGSVCDVALMGEVCEGSDVVIHAAAHKHVPICESNPIAAIENNVRGTLTLVNAVEQAGVGQFLLISTDKAVRPVSVMGSTKRVAEMIVSAKVGSRTIFSTVRFGNVLDSAGSVLPLWREQVASGLPITLTDPRCERYFMSIPEACALICGVLDMKRSGTFVPDMGKPKKLIDLARSLSSDIRCIGLRPGEKLTEELNYGGELGQTSHTKIMSVAEWKYYEVSMLENLLSASACRDTVFALQTLRDMVSED